MARPLPSQLGQSFTTSAALAAGVTPSRLRARDLDRPFHGVRVRRGARSSSTAEDAVLDRVRDYAVRMTGHEFFSHVAAAVMWGLPLPPRLVRDRPIDVGVFAPRRHSAGAGVRGHSVKPGHAHVVEHPQLLVPVTSPASTWAMLASELGLYDLVAVGDATVREPMHPTDPEPLTSVEQLSSAVSAGRRVGIARLRTALPLVCTRADSRPETWLRLVLTDAGLPAASVNHDVFVDGVWLARVDLAYPDLRIAVEYEGEQHLTDIAQWHRDIARLERLAEAGWRVIRVTKADVFGDSGPLIARVRRAVGARR